MRLWSFLTSNNHANEWNPIDSCLFKTYSNQQLAFPLAAKFANVLQNITMYSFDYSCRGWLFIVYVLSFFVYSS